MARGIRDWFTRRKEGGRLGRPPLYQGERPHISLLTELREHQQNRCAICDASEPGGQGDFHVDHDHATGKVRGLLCSRCNTSLGLYRDSPERLRRAADYLARGGVEGIDRMSIRRFTYREDLWPAERAKCNRWDPGADPAT